MRSDVIVVGAGCAGMVASLEAQREGAHVLLLARGPIGLGTNSALAGGGFAGPTAEHSVEDYVKEVLKAGEGINQNGLVKRMAREAFDAFSFLRSLGVNLVEQKERYRVKPAEPDSTGGVALVRTLASRIRETGGIDLLTGLYVTEILKREGAVCGVRGFDRVGRAWEANASAVILAMGGAGAVYLRNNNQKSTMGQGYLLAAKAGLDLWDMEFVQFYPLVVAEPALPAMQIYHPLPPEARVINAAGEDILAKYNMGDLDAVRLTKRDLFSAILFTEGERGPTYMDYRLVPRSFWKTHPLGKLKFDLTKKPLRILPAAHFFMGGVRIREDGRTSLPGLFACGEIAWGLHGANRIGGNALTECVVFGRSAGRSGARYGLDHSLPSRIREKALKRGQGGTSGGPGPLREFRERIREIGWRCAGVVRSEECLRTGLKKLLEKREGLKRITPRTVPERRLKEDLTSAVFVLEAIMTASLPRKETRGAFIREDASLRDDLHWCKNSCLSVDLEEGTFDISFHSVPNP
jgi:succinate dehydrogenase/fumarate reductase flavoprotein subunit